MIELSREERVFVQFMVVALVLGGIFGFFVFHEVVAALTMAGLLVGTAGLFATQVWDTPKVWLFTFASYAISMGGAPFAVRNGQDLLGLEAMLVALLVGTTVLFHRHRKHR